MTAGKAAGDPPAFGDTLQYVVTIVNGGNATAYDVNVVDTLPIELALSPGFTPTAVINAVPVVGFVPTPSGAPLGPLVWGRNNGDESLDIAAGGSLVLTYQVEVVTPSDNPDLIANNVWTDWTSLEGASVHERDGDGCPTITPPDDYCFGPAVAVGTAVPLPPPDLLKETTQATATIGEAFRYRITVPQTPYPIPMYDVRIRDDFAGSAADLRLLSVAKISGSEPWAPTNTGTPTNAVIEDPAIGIDVPVGEQIVLEITVVLQDQAVNVDGLSFTNTVSFLYNRTDGDITTQRPSDPATSGAMTVVEPDLTLEKTGPATMTVGTPASFTLNAHNVGTSTAWNLTITDQLPDLANGGMCGTPPTAVVAQVFASDGVTPVSPVLVEGTDYSSTFVPAPTCELRLAMLSAQAAIGVDQRLIVSYDARLDADTQNGLALTNVAGATEWFSTDGLDPQTVGDRRTYTRVLTDGTVGTLDHEDAYTVNAALPSYLFEKTVVNVTTGQDPATNASPGDVLRYQLRVENLTTLPLGNFALLDEVDRLNDPAVFVPGTLTLVTVPAGADTSNTNPTGGLRGTGVVDVRDLVFPGLNGTVVVEYEVTLASVIANGTLATNQAQLLVDSVALADSDDPNVNGQADPVIPGDEDPTRVQIDSAPVFQVEKISDDLTGDPAVLLAGETLRYTITVKNVGDDNAVDATLRDDIPVNTTYVPGSTTLNGTAVPDVSGLPPFATGLLIQAPEDPTPGAMRADPSATPDNVATLVFDVVVDPATLDGTVISNQAFVSAVGGGVVDQPSDDPATPLADDPTRDVVGNAPLLFAAKSVAIGVDGGTLGQVDPGDVLHYTITVTNSGAVPATTATLTDAVPANTTYVADTTLLNGLPVGQPDGGVAPLAAGIPISSADLTPPLPGAGMGTLSPGQSAVVEFDLLVNAGVPPGTLISNQAVVSTDQVPTLPTDGDGNPATGPEPTVVVVGDGQQVAITKQVAVVGGGPALAGGQLEYVVRAQNIGTVPATLVVITDDLDADTPGALSYVAGSATLDGAVAGVSVLGSVITADYSTLNGPLMPGQATTLRFRATLDAGLAMGTNVTNTGAVTWNNPPQMASASVSIAVGGTPGVGVVNGTVWHDADFDDALGLGERTLQGWTVAIYRNGTPLQSTTTDASGVYRIGGLAPNDTSADVYELRFTAPGAGPSTASLGFSASAFTDGPQRVTDVVVTPGSNLQDLNLPIDPNGVVYTSLERDPVAGARLTLLAGPGGAALPPSCFDDPTQQGQVTRSDGFYKFDLNFSDVACPSGGAYVLEVDAGSNYAAGYSQVIPPISDPSTPPLSVPACPGSVDDVVPAPAGFCEVQPSELAPPPSVPPRSVGTNHHVHLVLDASQEPGSSQIFNNHIPVDPVLGGVLGITKTTPKLTVSRGELVPYEITITNDLAVPLPDLTLVDRYPAGFRYVEGSARVDGRRVEPSSSGRTLTWTDLGVDAASTRSVVLLFAVGAGVGDGKFVNRAQAVSSLTGLALSGEATATVRVVPDPTFACTDVTGKVFDDANRNGVQDPGEPGLAGVRLVTLRGLAATTDAHGRYHVTCAATPSDQRGSNFFLKLDERTLPTGFRMSTRQTQAQRATRGKAMKLNFAASIHRVVALDMADAVFEPGSVVMRPQWRPRIDRLLDELEKAPSTLRLSYVADVEDEKLVERRLEAVKDQIAEAWEERGGGYRLTIEPEVFWRRGAPPEKPTAKAGGPE
ncbi:MAG: hypothetical protein QNK04_24155 [Myxococcota bacterium]|nr:hypothetical protein [Myxococcota bacterium]